MTPKRILGLAIAASTALASSAALAATGTPERVRGTIASATADSVTVDTHAAKPVTVALTGSTSYLKVEKSNLNKVEKGSYIGTATMDVDGTDNAPIVQVQPRASRFLPGSSADQAEQRRESKFDAEQRESDEEFDNNLNICEC